MVSGSLGVTPGLNRQVSGESSEAGALELSFGKANRSYLGTKERMISAYEMFASKGIW